MTSPVVPRGTTDPIAAIATAPGRGGIGVVRVSGPDLTKLVDAVVGRALLPRQATHTPFKDAAGETIDEGIALYFPAPHSYTGESVLELQGHGGPAVLARLLRRCLELGCRIARPGEFTERAFLNEKLDLAQAEGVADLIDANSEEAARSAARTLTGEFSRRVHQLTQGLTTLRVHVEACIDFPEEEIDPADRAAQAEQLQRLRAQLAELTQQARRGVVLRDGLTVVLIGRPNVGKSSLLNRLAEEEVAIVTPVPGTTRDYVRATVYLAGVPIHLIDTAGLRETDDPVEQIGINRTWAAIGEAGAALLIAEAGEMAGVREAEILARLPASLPIAWVYNKVDLYRPAGYVGGEGGVSAVSGMGGVGGVGANAGAGSTKAGPGRQGEEGRGAQVPRETPADRHIRLFVSALTGEGIEPLRAWLLETAGWVPGQEGQFLARERHLVALAAAAAHLDAAASHPTQYELFAEELRLAQAALTAITGAFSADDLLGEIFGRFCIGK